MNGFVQRLPPKSADQCERGAALSLSRHPRLRADLYTHLGRHRRAPPTGASKAPSEWTKASGPFQASFSSVLWWPEASLPRNIRQPGSHTRRNWAVRLGSAYRQPPEMPSVQASGHVGRPKTRPQRAGGLCIFRRGLPGPGRPARNRAASDRFESVYTDQHASGDDSRSTMPCRVRLPMRMEQAR